MPENNSGFVIDVTTTLLVFSIYPKWLAAQKIMMGITVTPTIEVTLLF
jgi:hypothetical protein